MHLYYDCRKKSAPHKGIIFLSAPEITQSYPTLPIHRASRRGHDFPDQEETRSLKEGEELSLSAPNSPKLTSSFHQKLSHSYDDLLASDESTRSPRAQPAITVTSPNRSDVSVAEGRTGGVFFLTPECHESNDESDDSECEPELVNLNGGSVVRHELTDLSSGVVNPLLQADDDPEGRQSRKSSSDSEMTGGKKLSRLKGRIMRTVKLFNKPVSPQPSGEESGETDAKQTPSPPPPLLPPAESDDGSRMATVMQRFKVNSPGLWRKMRRGASITPSEGEHSRAEARKNCKSRMIFI